MRYDIADHQCKAVLKKVLDTGVEIETPLNAAKEAMFTADTSSKSSKVGSALNVAANLLDGEVKSVENFYNLAVAQASYAVTIYQGGDEKMAKDAFEAALKTDTDAAPQARRPGGRAMPSAL